jgi:hypothetical protein
MSKVTTDGKVILEDGEAKRGVYGASGEVGRYKEDDSDDVLNNGTWKLATGNSQIDKKIYGNLPAHAKYVDEVSTDSFGRKVPENAVIKQGGRVLIQKECKYKGQRAIVIKVHSYEKGKITVRMSGDNKYLEDYYTLDSFNDYIIVASDRFQIDIDDPTVRLIKKKLQEQN